MYDFGDNTVSNKTDKYNERKILSLLFSPDVIFTKFQIILHTERHGKLSGRTS